MALFSFFNRSQVSQGQGNKEVTANDMLEALAKAAGYLNKSVAAGGTINLSQAESEYGIVALSGAPGSTVTVVKAALSTNPTLFYNITTGGQTIQVKMSGGTTYAVPLNEVRWLLASAASLELYDKAGADAAIAAAVIADDLAHAVALCFNAATSTWAAQPAGLTEFLGLNDRRRGYDLTGFKQARLVANVEAAGFAGSTLLAEFATTDGGTYAALDNSTGPSVAIDATGTIVSGWVNLTAGALADVFLRISGVGGNAVASPQIGLVEVQVR